MPRKTKAPEFPITVKSGSSSVKIYRDTTKGTPYYVIAFYLGGKRQRHGFPTLQEAQAEAEAKAALLSRGEVDAAQITSRDRMIYGHALEAIRGCNISLDAAATEYATSIKILKGHSLTEAARFYMKHHGQGIIPRTVQDAYKEFKASKETAGFSKDYIRDIKSRVGRFAESHRMEVRQLTAQDVADWLTALNPTPRTFNNFAGILETFFNFCKNSEYLSKETDLLAKVQKRKVTSSPIQIFTPKELRAILSHASPRVATCIAIQAFTGVRTAELTRLTWGDIEKRNGNVEVAAHKAKTASRRLVPITENLSTWLRAADRVNDRVWPVTVSEYHAGQEAAASKAGVQWSRNVLRHSFISYRVAATGDMARTAIEAGNSANMILKHYRELVTSEEAAEWFSIVPAKAATNITDIHAVA